MRCLTQASFRFEDGTWTKVAKAAPPPPRIEGISSTPGTSTIPNLRFETIIQLSDKMDAQFATLTELLLKMHDEQSKRLDKVEKELKELIGN